MYSIVYYADETCSGDFTQSKYFIFFPNTLVDGVIPLLINPYLFKIVAIFCDNKELDAEQYAKLYKEAEEFYAEQYERMDRETKNKIPFDWPCKEENMATSYRVSYKTTAAHTLDKSEEVSWCPNKECLIEKLRQLEDRPSVYSDIIVTVHPGKAPEEEIKPNHKAISDIRVLMRQFKINEDQISYILNEMNQSQAALDSCKTLKESYMARIRAIHSSLTDVDKKVLKHYPDIWKQGII